MTNTAWIIVGVVVLLLFIVGLVVIIGNSRKKAKTVSFEKKEPEAQKELTREEKSGNYQAKGGFNFAPAGAPAVPQQEKQPVRVDEPLHDGAEAPTEVFSAATPLVTPAKQINQPEDEPEALEDGAEAAAEQEAEEEATAVGTPVGNKVAEPVDVEPVGAQQVEPAEAAAVAEPAESVEQEPAEVADLQDTDLQDTEVEAVEAEAAEAAVAAKSVEEAAQEALEETPHPDAQAAAPEPTADQAAEIEEIAPAAGRIGRLRGRLSRSQNAIGQGLLGILSAGDLDEDAWEEIEDTLIMADLGAASTEKVVDKLREKIAERGVSSEAEARAMLRETLIEVGQPELDRSIKAMPNNGKPAVILVVGVNGTGKTTTTGKLARVLVSMGHTVLLGAADTFRAAAADQLETWGRRVGATTVRGAEGADPASVAFDAVKAGVEQQADVVLIDTAGRLHTATGLMDQLGKVKRVVEKKSQVDEVLLVLDATVGQNGLNQARVFKEVVEITGVVLTKLDGTAKGGIVFQVQEELGVPVKLVGLGEGADDLAPFEIEGFVDALLGPAGATR